MKDIIISFIFLFIGLALIFLPVYSDANEKNDSTGMVIFRKNEMNTGIVYEAGPRREELRTDISRDYEEYRMNAFKFRMVNRNWNFITYKQEEWKYMVEGGLFGGKGSIIDSSSTNFVNADHNFFGLQARAEGFYHSRFYYDYRNFTLVSINAWSGLDLYRQNSEGMVVDSNQVSSPYTESAVKVRFRAGFNVRAGWGIGRLININHLVTAERLLEKYYPQRVFSKGEIDKVKQEIGRIKHRRNRKAGHSAPGEAERLSEFLNRNMFLEVPVNIESDWQLTEFKPRYDGIRFEFGPFFNYFNYEPDFIYGGYINFENDKYCRPEWNRKFSAILSYNKYKNHDWLLLESEFSLTYYPNLKSEYNFGIRYIPGMDIRSLDDLGPVSHNIIPYIKYFSQLNSRWRIDMALALRVVSNDRYMLPGTEFTVCVYRSSY